MRFKVFFRNFARIASSWIMMNTFSSKSNFYVFQKKSNPLCECCFIITATPTNLVADVRLIGDGIAAGRHQHAGGVRQPVCAVHPHLPKVAAHQHQHHCFLVDSVRLFAGLPYFAIFHPSGFGNWEFWQKWILKSSGIFQLLVIWKPLVQVVAVVGHPVQHRIHLQPVGHQLRPLHGRQAAHQVWAVDFLQQVLFTFSTSSSCTFPL